MSRVANGKQRTVYPMVFGKNRSTMLYLKHPIIQDPNQRFKRIYNSHYGNGVPAMFYLLVLSSWKVNIAKNLIAVMGLKIRSGILCYSHLFISANPYSCVIISQGPSIGILHFPKASFKSLASIFSLSGFTSRDYKDKRCKDGPLGSAGRHWQYTKKIFR